MLTALRDPNARFARWQLAILYRWRHGRWPNLDRPTRFTEWVQWRKLNDRCHDRARLTDKGHSKRIAGDILGNEMMVPTLWQGTSLPLVPPWPMPFIVKSNHGCGQYIVVRSSTDWSRARAAASRWVATRYGGLLGEWHYRAADRALIVEPFIGSGDVLPIDYKIYVFGGRAVIIQRHEGRGGRHRWTQYNRDWKALSANASPRPAPVSLTRMLAAAERLGAGHDFIRTDFYEVGGEPLFGEFCLFPGSGLDRFDPVDLDRMLGAHWSAQKPEVGVAPFFGRAVTDRSKGLFQPAK